MSKKQDAPHIAEAKEIIGNLTPLAGHDCGKLCGAACCKGDNQTGMLLFPGEETTLQVTELENGHRLAVCDGTCDRSQRPLACMIFPFFPTVDDEGEVYAEIDARAYGACPLADHCDDVLFDEEFLYAVQDAGYVLAEDEDCLEFMYDITEQIDEITELREDLNPEA